MYRGNIEKSIVELNELIESESRDEQKYQKWFEDNPIVFKSLGYVDVISQPRVDVGDSYEEPDFIVKTTNGEWEIFEIKTPFEDLVTSDNRRPKFYSTINKYISQCHTYSECLDEASVRERLSNKYSIERIRKRPKSILVAGLSEGEDIKTAHKLSKRKTPNIKLFTYDDLYQSLKRHRKFHFDRYDKSGGISIYAVISLLKKPRTSVSNHILDIGKNKNKNRVSIFINKEEFICVRVKDVQGKEKTAKSREPLPRKTYNSEEIFQFEVGVGERMGFISVQIGWDYHADIRIGEFPFHAPEELVLGSDWSGSAPSWFNLKTILVFSNIIPFDDRHRLISTMKEGSAQVDSEAEFRGSGYLSTEGHPAD